MMVRASWPSRVHGAGGGGRGRLSGSHRTGISASADAAPQADLDVILIGGPQDGTVIAALDSGLVEVPIEGLTHRYILTSATRERDGKTHRVFNYDGQIRNTQAQPDVQAPGGHLGSGT
jgi:hypothetical protein